MQTLRFQRFLKLAAKSYVWGCSNCRKHESHLVDLYDPLTMPPALVKAHQKLDAAVDGAFGKKAFKNDAERVAFLFTLYQQYTSILPAESAAKSARNPRAVKGGAGGL